MLKGKNIDFSYSKDKTFIKNLNIDIPKGKVTTILGPNGSGKSTLLSILSCFNKPQKGDIYLDDIKLNKLKYKELIDFAIKATNLSEIRHKKVMDLSGGQRQRAFIAMSLAQNTEVLLLDEPTTYLDIYHQIEILEVVKKLNEEHNITIVMVLHDINQAIKYSHNIVIMKNGSIVNEGSPSKIINENIIKDVYQVEGFIGKDEDEIYFIPRKVC